MQKEPPSVGVEANDNIYHLARAEAVTFKTIYTITRDPIIILSHCFSRNYYKVIIKLLYEA